MKIVDKENIENLFKPKPRKVEPIKKINLKRYNKQKYLGVHIDIYA